MILDIFGSAIIGILLALLLLQMIAYAINWSSARDARKKEEEFERLLEEHQRVENETKAMFPVGCPVETRHGPGTVCGVVRETVIVLIGESPAHLTALDRHKVSVIIPCLTE